MAENIVALRRGNFANLPATRDADTLYFTLDTHQIFLGANEYTKGTKVLASEPTSSTVGDVGKLYAYNGSLYLCTAADAGSYTYVRVANINDNDGTVTSIEAGEGLETASGSAITSTGTIKHAVPSGAAVVTDPTADAAPAFGGTFSIQGVATDKFGHVVASNTRTITMPTETPVTVETATGTAQTLQPGGTFTVVSNVEVGAADQSVKKTTVAFTLPADANTTYTISSSEEGKVTLTPSDGTAQTITLNGWDLLAKKTDISAVFKFKGTVATQSALPSSDVAVGDVYYVTERSTEYVAKEVDPAIVWEEFGPAIDLSPYALSADVIQRVTGATGQVPQFNADGTLSSTGFTLGASVPADAKFTDTTYEEATTTDAGLMSAADKTKLDGIASGAEANVLEGVQVNGTDLTITNKKVNVQLSDFGVTATAADLNDINNKLDMTSGGTVTGAVTFSNGITADVTGDLTGTASNATADAAGNDIQTTYATKQELADAALVWQTF